MIHSSCRRYGRGRSVARGKASRRQPFAIASLCRADSRAAHCATLLGAIPGCKLPAQFARVQRIRAFLKISRVESSDNEPRQGRLTPAEFGTANRLAVRRPPSLRGESGLKTPRAGPSPGAGRRTREGRVVFLRMTFVDGRGPVPESITT